MSISLVLALAGCGNAEQEGRAAAQKQAALETKHEIATTAAVKVIPPVPGRAHVPCEQLLDTAAFTEAMAEVEPLTIKDTTSSDAEAAASCGLIRGGVRPDQSQQAAIIKKSGGRLGTIPGDELCNITAYCWTLEDPVKFMDKCKTSPGRQADESIGATACLQIIQQGADDVYSFEFYDADTKCLLKVRGGPSMIDNALITTCAKGAHDLIGKPQIAVGGAPAPAPTDPAAVPPTTTP